MLSRFGVMFFSNVEFLVIWRCIHENGGTYLTGSTRMVEGRKELGLRRFQQLRSYRDEIETRNREEIPSNSSKGSFSCRKTIDSPPQRRTFI